MLGPQTRLFYFLLSTAIALNGCATAAASLPKAPPQSSHMQTGRDVVAPFGFIGFCIRSPRECKKGPTQSLSDLLPDANFHQMAVLNNFVERQPSVDISSGKLWFELNRVNDFVNSSVAPLKDTVQYGRLEWWAYPTAKGGDCEDYALLKRKLLNGRGWPISSLSLAVAKQWDGTGHTVLIVVTQQGEYVLDNQRGEILPWHAAPYVWIKRQSSHDPQIWVNLDPARESQATGAAQ